MGGGGGGGGICGLGTPPLSLDEVQNITECRDDYWRDQDRVKREAELQDGPGTATGSVYPVVIPAWGRSVSAPSLRVAFTDRGKDKEASGDDTVQVERSTMSVTRSVTRGRSRDSKGRDRGREVTRLMGGSGNSLAERERRKEMEALRKRDREPNCYLVSGETGQREGAVTDSTATMDRVGVADLHRRVTAYHRFRAAVNRVIWDRRVKNNLETIRLKTGIRPGGTLAARERERQRKKERGTPRTVRASVSARDTAREAEAGQPVRKPRMSKEILKQRAFSAAGALLGPSQPSASASAAAQWTLDLLCASSASASASSDASPPLPSRGAAKDGRDGPRPSPNKASDIYNDTTLSMGRGFGLMTVGVHDPQAPSSRGSVDTGGDADTFGLEERPTEISMSVGLDAVVWRHKRDRQERSEAGRDVGDDDTPVPPLEAEPCHSDGPCQDVTLPD
ncbi:hypothetical protein KIPB_000365 [Kipferlia bialata]|uniref:Uncharacterized protein n=1 Tax=Kipferlia bialata TaxID=797122 RepID=A0A9K3CP42_9EUKA|nr:hypothetical protein KIPB_000365 [Kipferlia bialata]|eukprot:g365.t1